MESIKDSTKREIFEYLCDEYDFEEAKEIIEYGYYIVFDNIIPNDITLSEQWVELGKEIVEKFDLLCDVDSTLKEYFDYAKFARDYVFKHHSAMIEVELNEKSKTIEIIRK